MSTNWIKPLSFKMKPTKISEVVGQEHIIGEGKILTTMVENNTIFSFILFGKSGTGKTSIAQAISGSTGIPLKKFNASKDAKKDLQSIIKEAEENEQTTFIFIDEIHRMTKPIQDFLLPYMENGLISIIGATTENPYISVNPAVRSRARLIELKPLSKDNIKEILISAIKDKSRGLGNYQINISDDSLNFIANNANGDARIALNNLELAVSLENKRDSEINISTKTLETVIQKKDFDFGNGDTLYNTMSAFQKSLRGSDVNASLYYLARMLLGGELEAVCRRLMVCVYEDVGVANPLLPMRVNLAIETALQVGMPEARIPLAMAVTEVALSSKSNATYLAINKAMEHIEQNGLGEIPLDLQDNHYKGASDLGKGLSYKYPFNYDNNFIEQQYLPYDIKNIKFFEPEGKTTQEEKYKKVKDYFDEKLKD